MTRLLNLNMSQDALTVFFDQRVSHSGLTNSENNSMKDTSKDIKQYFEKLFSEGESLYVDEEKMMTGKELLDFFFPKVNQGEIIIPASRKMVFCYYMYLEQLSQEWIDQFFKAETEYWKSNPAENFSDYQYIIAFCFKANTIPDKERMKYTQLLRILAQRINHNGILNRQIFLLRISGFDDYSRQEHALVQRLYLMSRKDSVFMIGTGSPIINMLNYMDYYENRASECLEGIEKIDNWIEVPVDPQLQEFSKQLNTAASLIINQLEDIRKKFSVRSRIYPVRIDQFSGNCLFGYKLKGSQNNPRLNKRKKEFIEKEKDRILEQTDFSSVIKLMENEYHYPDRKELIKKLNDNTLEDVVTGRERTEQENNPVSEDSIKKDIFRKIKGIVKKTTENSEELLETKKAEKRKLQKMQEEAGRYKDIENCFNNIAIDIIPMQARMRQMAEKRLVALISGSPAQNWDIRHYNISGIDTAYRYPKISPCEIAVLLEYDMVPVDDSMEDIMNRLY